MTADPSDVEAVAEALLTGSPDCECAHRHATVAVEVLTARIAARIAARDVAEDEVTVLRAAAAAALPTPITRPNGKVWRGRLPIRFTEFETFDNETGFVVLGTHDVRAAFDLLGGYADYYGLDVEQAEQRWWRLVPWSNGSFDYTWIDDTERGTPCVVFNP